jgi:hypothetical protein
METVRKIEVTIEKKTSINGLSVGASFYGLRNVVLSLASRRFVFNRTEEAEKHFLLTFSMYPTRLMSLYRLVLVPKETNCNEKALKLAQQIPSPVNAIKNEMRQPTENSQMERSVPATESRTSFETLTTKLQTWRDKFSEIVPKAFAPP